MSAQALKEGKPEEIVKKMVEGRLRKHLDEITLTGPVERIRERLESWKESPVTTLLLPGNNTEAMRTLAELVL